MFQCFLNYYTRWVSIRSLLRSKLLVIKNMLQISSKARVNTSISKQVIFRPCLNESKKSLCIYSTYVVSIRSLTIYWIVLYILFLGENMLLLKNEKNKFKTWKLRHMLRTFLITPKWCLDLDLDVLPYEILKTLAHFLLKSKQQHLWYLTFVKAFSQNCP
jgi:hypothetical protein